MTPTPPSPNTAERLVLTYGTLMRAFASTSDTVVLKQAVKNFETAMADQAREIGLGAAHTNDSLAPGLRPINVFERLLEREQKVTDLVNEGAKLRADNAVAARETNEYMAEVSRLEQELQAYRDVIADHLVNDRNQIRDISLEGEELLEYLLQVSRNRGHDLRQAETLLTELARKAMTMVNATTMSNATARYHCAEIDSALDRLDAERKETLPQTAVNVEVIKRLDQLQCEIAKLANPMVAMEPLPPVVVPQPDLRSFHSEPQQPPVLPLPLPARFSYRPAEEARESTRQAIRNDVDPMTEGEVQQELKRAYGEMEFAHNHVACTISVYRVHDGKVLPLLRDHAPRRIDNWWTHKHEHLYLARCIDAGVTP